MARNEMLTTGTLHGLKRQIGKIGGEYIGFAITTHDLGLWDELVGHAEQPVEIVIRPAQKSLPLDPEDAERKAAGGNQTVAAARNGDRAEQPPKTPKEPKGKHAVQDDPRS
jgi:hypothetical protein